MRKLACFCDHCAIAADWRLQPAKQNMRFFELIVSCHGEQELFLVAASELLYMREPSGREVKTPLYVIAFEEEKPSTRIRVIETLPRNLSIRIPNYTNRLMR